MASLYINRCNSTSAGNSRERTLHRPAVSGGWFKKLFISSGLGMSMQFISPGAIHLTGNCQKPLYRPMPFITSVRAIYIVRRTPFISAGFGTSMALASSGRCNLNLPLLYTAPASAARTSCRVPAEARTGRKSCRAPGEARAGRRHDRNALPLPKAPLPRVTRSSLTPRESAKSAS